VEGKQNDVSNSVFLLTACNLSTNQIETALNMQSLLRWAIENSGNDGPPQPPQPRRDLDPGIIDHILGKPDSVLMLEALAIAVDKNRVDDDRVVALDNLEMVSPEANWSQEF
jgi:hypothetical protein